jgi:hypothetical protein
MLVLETKFILDTLDEVEKLSQIIHNLDFESNENIIEKIELLFDIVDFTIKLNKDSTETKKEITKELCNLQLRVCSLR